MMSAPRPANKDTTRDRPANAAIDVAGQIWRHHNPVELYRFIKSRNDLLKAIIAGQR